MSTRCDSYECNDCGAWQHLPRAIDDSEARPQTCSYCGGELLWRSDAMYRLMEVCSPRGTEPEEVRIGTERGATIAAPAYPCDCYYVRLLDEEGRETGYWDNAEWRDDPQLVMGAIIGAINAGG